MNGGRPDHFAQDHPVYSLKLMVFAGITSKGKIFGLKIYRNQSMTGPVYHSLLHHQALPDLRANNGGNLDGFTWTQDGAPCHVTNKNMAYLDRQFGEQGGEQETCQG